MSTFTKLFETKVADEKANQYDGVHGGTMWFKQTKQYFIGQAADCIPLLHWAEMHGEMAITPHEVQWLAQSNTIGCQNDPTVLSGHMELPVQVPQRERVHLVREGRAPQRP